MDFEKLISLLKENGVEDEITEKIVAELKPAEAPEAEEPKEELPEEPVIEEKEAPKEEEAEAKPTEEEAKAEPADTDELDEGEHIELHEDHKEEVDDLKKSLDEHKAVIEGLLARVQSLEEALEKAGVLEEMKPVGVDKALAEHRDHEEGGLEDFLGKINRR